MISFRSAICSLLLAIASLAALPLHAGYIIYNTATQQITRGEREERFSIDGQRVELTAPLVELSVIRQEFPVLALNERAIPTRTVDLTAKTLTYGYTVETYTPSAEEIDERAMQTEAEQLRTVYTALKNGTGTSAERMARVERVCAFLLKAEAQRRGLIAQ